MSKNNTPIKLINFIIWLCQKKLIDTQQKETGSVLIIVIVMGLLVLGTTSLALINSGKSKTNAQVEEYTKRAMATTEAGVTRTVEKLSSDYRDFLTLNYPNPNEWKNPPSDTFVSPCAENTTSKLDTNILKGDLGNNRSYEVKSYVYDKGSQIGTLTVKGQENVSDYNSQAQIDVAMKIDQFVPPSSFPGLYGNTIINLGNNDVFAETAGEEFGIICTNCESSLAPECQNGEPSDAYLKDAIGIKNNNAQVEGEIVIGLPKLPDYPAPPNAECSASQGYPCFIVIEPVSVSTTFPRQADIDNRTTWGWPSEDLNKPYIYIIKYDTKGEKNSVTGKILTIDSTIAPVIWYVAGHIKLSGSLNFLVHEGTLENFAIFGCTKELDDVMKNNSISPACIEDPYTDQEIKLNGGDIDWKNPGPPASVFIYAPNANVGINGSKDFHAVIWANAWDMSSGTGASLTIPDNASTLLSSEFGQLYGEAGIQYNRISNLTEWKRTKVE